MEKDLFKQIDIIRNTLEYNMNDVFQAFSKISGRLDCISYIIMKEKESKIQE